jgi:hypothetical protein
MDCGGGSSQSVGHPSFEFPTSFLGRHNGLNIICLVVHRLKKLLDIEKLKRRERNI